MELAQTEHLRLGGPPESGALNEAALIRAAQKRDPDAFEQLVRLHDRAVLRVTMNLLRSPEDARDAYQEAFLKVYRKLDTFRFDCSFSVAVPHCDECLLRPNAPQGRAQGNCG